MNEPEARKRPPKKSLPDLLPLSRSPMPSDAENNNFMAPKFTIISDHTLLDSSSVSSLEVVTDISENFGEGYAKKRKTLDSLCVSDSKFANIEKKERLFIRLVNINVSSEASVESPKPRLSLVQAEPTKKVSKTELHSRNLININKTESMKMEELLLKKFKKTKEKEAQSGVVERSETSGSEIEPYVYEKTTKSVYETYEQVTGQNGDMILRCLLCPFIGETFKQMSLHYKFKHRETPIEEMHFCNVKGCKFKTIHRGMLKWHMRRHMLASDKLESEIFPCIQCDKVFDQRKGFLIHLKHMHKDPVPESVEAHKDFPCGTCNFRTTTKQNLRTHIYRCHIPDEGKPKFTCNICGFHTLYKDSFRKHLTRVHLKQDK